MKNQPKALFISTRQTLTDILLLSIGSVLCAIAINGILIPNHFVTGGITGVALVINKFTPLKVGWIYLIINIPLFAAAWMAVGRRFFFYSVFGALTITLSMLFVHLPIHLEDKMLNALLAGVILGVGSGLSLRSSGSQGGTDILSIMLLKRFSISIGDTILFMNVSVLLLISIFYSIEAVLYTLIVVFVGSKITHIVITGLSQRKSVVIVSQRWEEISDEILKDIKRGVTMIKGGGGYTKRDGNILYVVVTLMELGEMKRIISAIDPDAFVVISDTLEVINYRIGNQPHW